jgi:hypothetical protein
MNFWTWCADRSFIWALKALFAAFAVALIYCVSIGGIPVFGGHGTNNAPIDSQRSGSLIYGSD